LEMSSSRDVAQLIEEAKQAVESAKEVTDLVERTRALEIWWKAREPLPKKVALVLRKELWQTYLELGTNQLHTARKPPEGMVDLNVCVSTASMGLLHNPSSPDLRLVRATALMKRTEHAEGLMELAAVAVMPLALWKELQLRELCLALLRDMTGTVVGARWEKLSTAGPPARYAMGYASAEDGLSHYMFGGVPEQDRRRSSMSQEKAREILEMHAPMLYNTSVDALLQPFNGDAVECLTSISTGSMFRKRLNDVWVLKADAAGELPPLWSQVLCTGEVPPEVEGPLFCVLGDALYTTGGEVEIDLASEYCDLYRLDLKTRRWKRVKTKGTRPASRKFGALFAHLGKLHMWGGRVPGQKGDPDLWVLDPSKVPARWECRQTQKGDTAVPNCSQFNWWVEDGELVVYGGVNEELDDDDTADMHASMCRGTLRLCRLNLATGTWTRDSHSPYFMQPLAEVGCTHSVDGINNFVYGGYWDGNSRPVARARGPGCVPELNVLTSFYWKTAFWRSPDDGNWKLVVAEGGSGEAPPRLASSAVFALPPGPDGRPRMAVFGGYNTLDEAETQFVTLPNTFGDTFVATINPNPMAKLVGQETPPAAEAVPASTAVGSEDSMLGAIAQAAVPKQAIKTGQCQQHCIDFEAWGEACRQRVCRFREVRLAFSKLHMQARLPIIGPDRVMTLDPYFCNGMSEVMQAMYTRNPVRKHAFFLPVDCTMGMLPTPTELLRPERATLECEPFDFESLIWENTRASASFKRRFEHEIMEAVKQIFSFQFLIVIVPFCSNDEQFSEHDMERIFEGLFQISSFAHDMGYPGMQFGDMSADTPFAGPDKQSEVEKILKATDYLGMTTLVGIVDKCCNPPCVKTGRKSGSRDLTAAPKGMAEGHLVKLSMCASCHTVWYCSKECQKAHWKEHKAICKEATAARKQKS